MSLAKKPYLIVATSENPSNQYIFNYHPIISLLAFGATAYVESQEEGIGTDQGQ